jgi:D-glycero-alpha-D-manno-heptose 1-phosphate guanylyltransferase
MGQEMSAVLLVGGMGTRLRAVVPSKPKPLASVGDKAFLELLVRQLRRQGICRLILCVGYLADQIENQFGDGSELDTVIEYSKEIQPLGTAGAVKQAQSYLRGSDQFLVMNGDSFMEINFSELLSFHSKKQALATIAVRRIENAGRYGTVEVSAGNRVTAFVEKTGKEAPGLVNAGVYVFDRAIFDSIPNGPSSLEKDIFPNLLDRGVYAVEQQGMFIDIGTPEDYARAQELYDRMHTAALLKES